MVHDRPLPEDMRKPIQLMLGRGTGEAWYYISPNGLELYFAPLKGRDAVVSFRLSLRKLQTALSVIESERKGRK
jgi:hypothetical protein